MNAMTNVNIEPKGKASSFTRSRALNFAKEQYRLLKNSEKNMNITMEMVRMVGHQDYHEKAFYEALGSFRTAATILDHFCAAFGIEAEEIGPKAVG